MAWTTPPTFTAGTELAADDLNLLGDDLNYLKGQTDLAVFKGVAANRTTNQSIPDSTDTDVTMTTEVWDEGGWITVSSTTATVPAGAIPAGYTNVILDIRYVARFAGSANGSRRLIVNQSGSQIYSKAIPASGSAAITVDFAIHASAAAGDTFKVQVWQDSGGALNITSAGMDLSVYKPLS